MFPLLLAWKSSGCEEVRRTPNNRRATPGGTSCRDSSPMKSTRENTRKMAMVYSVVRRQLSANWNWSKVRTQLSMDNPKVSAHRRRRWRRCRCTPRCRMAQQDLWATERSGVGPWQRKCPSWPVDPRSWGECVGDREADGAQVGPSPKDPITRAEAQGSTLDLR